MHVLFCTDPLQPGKPDPEYHADVAAARAAGFEVLLLNYEALVYEDAVSEALRRVPSFAEPAHAVYRGWMLKPSQYRRLYEALAARGIVLINTPEQYRHCHYLPDSYPVVAAHTPRSVWTSTRAELDLERVMGLLKPFGDGPVVVKDWVKSQKHYWHEACFIPSASDRVAVERVTRRFVELQGADLAEGLVFREWVEFEPLGLHSRSGMPLTREYRLFFFEDELLEALPYWDEGKYEADALPLERFREWARPVRSRFFTMDVARRRDGDWMIVELGDAQVAGLPDHADAELFYRSLAEHWPAGAEGATT